MIGLSEVQQQIRHIFCKGLRYPTVIPRPQVGLMPFEMPLCEKTTTRGKFEEKYLRSKVSAHLLGKLLEDGYEVENHVEDNLKGMGEALLRIFAMALTSNCEALALEISYLMPNQKAVEAASRFARSKRCTALAEKLNEVMFEKGNEVAEELDVDENMQHHASPHKNSVVLAEKPTAGNHLAPKALSFGHRKNDASDDEEYTATGSQFIEDEDDGDGESLRPKAPPKTLNPFKVAAGSGKTKKRTRKQSDEENESDDDGVNNQAVLEFFFKANKRRLEEENEGVDEDDLRAIARDEFDSLPAEDKKEWIESAIKPRNKKTKKVRA